MKRRRKKKNSLVDSNFDLQITALIDTLVILLIFMLKSTSMQSLEIETEADLVIPMVNDGKSTASAESRLSINSDGLFWNGEQFIVTENFRSIRGDQKATSTQWKDFSIAVSTSANSEKEKYEAAGKKFVGKIYIEADRDTPYTLLDRALKVAHQHGYMDIRFVGARYN